MPTIDHDGSQITALMKHWYPIVLTAGADDAASTLGLSIEFDLAMATAQQVQKDRLKLIRNVSDTTRDDVDRIRKQGAREGWDPRQVRDAISALGEIASETRAELIAVTELANMYNLGSLLLYEQSEQVSGVEVLDGTNDEICAAANGQVWTLDEARDNPTGHPRCVRAFAPVLT